MDNLTTAAAGFAALGEPRRAGEELLEAGTVSLRLGESTDALEQFTEALRMFEQADWECGAIVALQRRARALFCSDDPDADEIFEVVRQAYARALKLPESEEYDVGWMRADAADDVARALQQRDEFSAALEMARNAVDGYLIAGDLESVASSSVLVGSLLFDLQDFVAAEEMVRRVLRDDPPEGATQQAQDVLARVLEATGRDSEAAAMWAELYGE
ncbi:hypothetical protein [Fodinicola feengrottensis]|uniref:hypothetical protein n=1 Tax=Fodinicola feengrottensis TaxID=435914 RepID=UPI0013D3FD70|nr:hypothetical protein [Fodinicola feengrottensis]